MPITFTALATVHIDGAADGALLLQLDGYGPTITMATGFADGAVALSGDATAYESDADVEPMLPTEGDGALYLDMDAEGSLGVWGAADESFALPGEAYADMGDTTFTGFADGGFQLEGAAMQTAPLEAYGFLVDFPPQVEGYGGLMWDRLEEAATFNEASGAHVNAILASVLRFSSPTSGLQDADVSVESSVQFDTAIHALFLLLIEEGVVFGTDATVDPFAVARAADRLLLEGHASSLAEAAGLVTTGLVFGTLTDMLALASADDELVMGAQVAELFTGLQEMVDAAVFGIESTPVGTGMALTVDALAFDALPATQAELQALLRDSVGFTATLALDSGEYVAWVLNTESAGLSRYTNYPFNSFMALGGKHYGITSAGIFLLEGATDDGEQIKARIRLGLSDLGTRVIKSVPEAYIGYASDGTMLLRAISINPVSGAKEAAEYLMQPRAAAATRESRFKLGRGVRSVDWDFELENVDGADFDLESIEFHPIRMDRRTRS